ncbi:MAG TPA: hypothetical protein VF498_14750, partial [Anaerolineales bacterium]
MENVENDLGSGAAGLPSQPASPNGEQPSAVDYEALAKALEPTLARMVERQWQSGKDSRIAKLTGKVDDFESRLARFKELQSSGMSEMAAKEFMKLESQIAQSQPDVPQTGASPTPQPGSQGQATDSFDRAAFLRQAGIDPNDPEVTALVREGKTALVDLAGLVVKRGAQPKVQPNPATYIPTGTGGAVPDEIETVTQQLTSAMRNPVANRKLIQELSAKQEALL